MQQMIQISNWFSVPFKRNLINLQRTTNKSKKKEEKKWKKNGLRDENEKCSGESTTDIHFMEPSNYIFRCVDEMECWSAHSREARGCTCNNHWVYTIRIREKQAERRKEKGREERQTKIRNDRMRYVEINNFKINLRWVWHWFGFLHQASNGEWHSLHHNVQDTSIAINLQTNHHSLPPPVQFFIRRQQEKFLLFVCRFEMFVILSQMLCLSDWVGTKRASKPNANSFVLVRFAINANDSQQVYFATESKIETISLLHVFHFIPLRHPNQKASVGMLCSSTVQRTFVWNFALEYSLGECALCRSATLSPLAHGIKVAILTYADLMLSDKGAHADTRPSSIRNYLRPQTAHIHLSAACWQTAL